MGKPPNLRQLQNRFFSLMTEGEGGRDRSQREAAALVTGDDRLDAWGRVRIYGRMYFDRLWDDVLRVDFPRVEAAMGESGFLGVVKDYLVAHPPDHPQIKFVSAGFAPFLERHKKTRGRPWLAELAWLEWSRVDVFDAADAIPLRLEAIQTLSPAELIERPMRAIAALAYRTCAFAVDEIWRRAEGANARKAPQVGRRGLMVWRHDLVVRHRVVTGTEALLVPMLLKGTTFGALCERAARRQSSEKAAQVVGPIVAGWISGGVVEKGQA